MADKQLEKEQIFNYALLFSIAKSAVTRALNCNTNKTDRIIFNSLFKAIAKHNNAKQEND